MRIIYRRRPKHIEPQVSFRFNQYIRVPNVNVIDETGKNLGVMPTFKALQLAQEKELDLVEVNPKLDPPVAKIMDFGQFKYEKEKELRKQKASQKKFEIKGVRLSSRIGQHDLDIRKAQALNFLKEGHKVQIELILRGRERQFWELSKDVIKNFIESINTELPVKIEQPISKQGNKFSCLIAKQ
jgi:translation initiation factor IF-3